MKNLKIAVSLVGLLISFSFVNAGAMENIGNINQQNQQGKIPKTGFVLKEYCKCIFFNVTNREFKRSTYETSTKIAEKVLKRNIDVYKRMINRIYENGCKPSLDFYTQIHFDLDCVRFLLDKYIDELKSLVANREIRMLFNNNQIGRMEKYYEAFKRKIQLYFYDFVVVTTKMQ